MEHPHLALLQSAFVLLAGIGLGLSCVGEIGTQGPTGPEGPMGAMGVAGTTGSPDPPAQVLAKFNSAVQTGGQVVLGSIGYSGPQYDFKWGLANAVSLSTCLGAGGTTIYPSSNGISCTAVCAANTGGNFTTCVNLIRVFFSAVTKPQAHTDQLSRGFIYPCSNAVAAPGDTVDPKSGPDDVNVCCCR